MLDLLVDQPAVKIIVVAEKKTFPLLKVTSLLKAQ